MLEVEHELAGVNEAMRNTIALTQLTHQKQEPMESRLNPHLRDYRALVKQATPLIKETVAQRSS